MNPSRRLAPHLVALALILGPGATRAGAQTIRPWMPVGTDSVVVWTTLAKTRFQLVRGDSAGGTNLEGYQRVADAAQHMLWRLGKQNIAQSPAIETVLDSLGLDTDLRYDPQVPEVVFLMVRNPYRPSADAVGYLMWFIKGDLRTQGIVYPPNRAPRMRAWFTGSREAPYEVAVLFQTRREPYGQFMHLYRAAPNGFGWSVIQYERDGPDFGPPGDAQFVDVNNDGKPEIVSWTPTEPDSFITLMGGIPRIFNEGLWVERPQGFVLHDSHPVPSPIATFTAFVRALLAGNHGLAERLLVDPARLREAVSLGWAAEHAKGAWRIEYGEEGEAWPEWFEVRFHHGTADTRYIVHFTWRDGRWLIHDWIPVRQAPSHDRPITPRAAPGRPK